MEELLDELRLAGNAMPAANFRHASPNSKRIAGAITVGYQGAREVVVSAVANTFDQCANDLKNALRLHLNRQV